MKRSFLALGCVALALAGCGSSQREGDVVKRDGEPDIVRVSDEDAEMNKAVQMARSTAEKFIASLKAPSAKQTGFSVKKPFREGGKVEHIWLSDVSVDNSNFKGLVGNDPIDVKNIKLGDPATVAKDEISDWMYIEDGKLVGGYTIRVLYSRMSPEEKKDFSANLGFIID